MEAGNLFSLIVFFFFVVVGLVVWGAVQKSRRTAFIDGYAFPGRVRDKVAEHYPHLSGPQLDDVMTGLREYFHICNLAGRRMVAMPSQVVDVAWHEFLLFTRQYRDFCKQGLGRFLDHTPAEAMESPTKAQNGIKRAWRLSCHRAKEDVKNPTALPVLFALDSQLAIADGFEYELNCLTTDDKYCAGHIGGCGGCGGCSGGDGCGGGCGGD